MGREERRQTVLPAPPRQALRVLFASAGEYFRSYHSAYTKDDACSVAPWDESRRRVVSFKKKLDVPAAVLKLLGEWRRRCTSCPAHNGPQGSAGARLCGHRP